MGGLKNVTIIEQQGNLSPPVKFEIINIQALTL